MNKISEEAGQIIRGMSGQGMQDFIDHCTNIVFLAQPREHLSLEDACNQVINSEALAFSLKLKREKEGETLREAIRNDMAGRFTGRPIVAGGHEAHHEESGDPSEILDRAAKRLMGENPKMSYGQALSQAQMEHRDLATKILKQLNEYRAR